MPPSSHFIYIPAMLILGVVLGFIWGAKATSEAVRLEQKRLDDRARRKAERAAAAAGQADSPAGQADSKDPPHET